jgi:2-dehydropantoate 2-reductase
VRYVVYGIGAVGGTIAARLHAAGREVVSIARGKHLDAVAADGLVLDDPDGRTVARIDVVGEPGALEWRDDDVVVLAMKTQDTAAAVRALAELAPPTVTVVCAQNGVENERIALRSFERVQAMCVMLPATHLEPGVVQANATPVPGILDVGRYPAGADEVTEAVAADLTAAGFSSAPHGRVMRAKYAKLLMNLGNALEAACGAGARGSDLVRAARDEGVACFAAAGIDHASEEEDRERRGSILQLRPVAGRRRGGGSSWQSLARGTGSIEADHLNGEIVLLGRLHGVPTPVNATLQAVANELARSGAAPGAMALADVERRVGA